VPVYKCPVFQQSSPKLDLILNINILESSPCASPFPHLLHKPLRVVSSNTRDFYLFKYLPPVHLLVQVVLSRPVEALTCRRDTWALCGHDCDRGDIRCCRRDTWALCRHERDWGDISQDVSSHRRDTWALRRHDRHWQDGLRWRDGRPILLCRRSRSGLTWGLAVGGVVIRIVNVIPVTLVADNGVCCWNDVLCVAYQVKRRVGLVEYVGTEKRVVSKINKNFENLQRISQWPGLGPQRSCHRSLVGIFPRR